MIGRRASRLAGATIVAAVLAWGGTAAAREPDWVIPPGKEGFFADVLGGDAPVAGCTRSGVSIDRSHVVARFRCGADEAVIEIRPRNPGLPDAVHTGKFTLRTRGAAPPPLVEALRERVLAREAGFEWIEAEDAGRPRRTAVERALRALGMRWHQGLGTAIAIIAGTLLLGAGLVLAGRRAGRPGGGSTPPAPIRVTRPGGGSTPPGPIRVTRPGGGSTPPGPIRVTRPGGGSTPPAAGGPSPSPAACGVDPPPGLTSSSSTPLFGRLLGGGFVVVALVVVSRFRFIEDDFIQLIRAVDRPWEMDDSLRLLSSTLFYGAGLRLGTWWFMGVNLVVWIGSVGLLHALLRRAGHARDEAAIGAALYGMSPGYFPLVRSATGFQTSASIGLYYVILLLVDAAGRTRGEERARRAGLLVIALGLTSLGVFIKYPMMSVVPFLAWVWGKRIVRAAPRPLSRHAFYASFVAAVGVPLLLTHFASADAGELPKAGLGKLAANVSLLGSWLFASLVNLCFAALFLYLGLALRRGAGWAGRRALVRAAILEDLRALGGVDRWGPFALLAAIAAAPFLFNALYFAPYYVVPCWAWIAALVAIPLARAARRVEGRAHVLTVLTAVMMVPTAFVTRTLEPGVKNEPGALLDTVRRATEGRPAPCGVRLLAACPTSEATAASAADLRALYDCTGNGDGVRWASGWHAIGVAVEGDPRLGAIPESCAAPLTLRYCAGEGMRAVEAPR